MAAADRKKNPTWFNAETTPDLTPVTVTEPLCFANGYAYKQHEVYPNWYECSRCGVELDDDGQRKKGREGV